MGAHPDDDHGGQCSVETSISSTIKSVPQSISRRCWYRAGPGQCGERRLRAHATGMRPRRQYARSDHQADPGQLTQFWSDVFDGGIERLAIVDQLGIEGDDTLGQPDSLMPAGTNNGVLAAVTPSCDNLELPVRQGLTRIDPKVDGAQQRRQSVDSPGAFSDHLLASHNQHPQHHPLAGGSGPPQPRGVDRQDRARDTVRVQRISLADPATRGGRHLRGFGDQHAGIGDALGKPGSVRADAFDDDQRRLLGDAAGDPTQCTVQSWRCVREHRLINNRAGAAMTSANEWVAAWVSTPMTNVYCSATMGMATLGSFL